MCVCKTAKTYRANLRKYISRQTQHPSIGQSNICDGVYCNNLFLTGEVVSSTYLYAAQCMHAILPHRDISFCLTCGIITIYDQNCSYTVKKLCEICGISERHWKFLVR